MGNQMPDSFNQSSEVDNKPDSIEVTVQSVISDIVNAIAMSNDFSADPAPDPSHHDMEDETLDNSELYYTCLTEEPESFNELDETVVEGEAASNGSERSSPEVSVSPNNENGYSSSRSSGSTSLSDWKYTPNGYPNDYESIGSKYNDILDAWNSPKDSDPCIPARIPVKPPRTSIIRKFDPLFSSPNVQSSGQAFNSLQTLPTKDKSRSLDRKASDELATIRLPFNSPHDNSRHLRVSHYASRPESDTTGQVRQFEQTGINESVTHFKSCEPEETTLTAVNANPKPDVLPFAENGQKDREESEKRINSLLSELKNTDSQIEELTTQLNTTKDNEKKCLNLINVLHSINEEIVINAHKAIDAKVAEMDAKVAEMEEQMESLLSKKASLESENTDLKCKLSAIQKSKTVVPQNSGNDLMTYRMQLKRLEMKNEALENELESKRRENSQLSAMVDDLIAKVHNH